MQQGDYLTSQGHLPVADESGINFDYRYLAAKKKIDDRALNHHVWQNLCQALPETTGLAPVKIVEIGAGIGTMLQRMVERGVLAGPVTYVATDSDPDQLRAAKAYLSQWARIKGHNLSWSGEYHGLLSTAAADITLVLDLASAEALAERSDYQGLFHLIIAHAVLDLVDFPALLPRLFLQLTAHGLAYFTCNFDGKTVFLPEFAGEENIVRDYHGSMEARFTGASQTGRRLLTFLQGSDMELLDAGSSDWIIHPRYHHYSSDETFFLHAIIETVKRELTGKPNQSSRTVDIITWARLRHQQVEAGKLSFLASNLDLLARRQPGLP